MRSCLLTTLFIFSSFSNQDVLNNKPHPEIYLKCLIDIGCKPNETLIFEDSSHGVMAAQDSGCHLFTVKNLSDISYNNIYILIGENITVSKVEKIFLKFKNSKNSNLNVLIVVILKMVFYLGILISLK